MRRTGLGVLVCLALAGLLAPWLAPNPPTVQYRDYVWSPPARPRILGPDGSPQGLFIYPPRLVDRIERRYEPDVTKPTSLAWFTRGRLLTSADPSVPWFPLGTDALGRDVAARLLLGARASIGVAFLATLGALLLGAVIGGVAGYVGGAVDEVLMRATEVVLVLPVLYVVLALRASLPLVLPPFTLFVILVVVLALVGWPTVARGVRGIVANEAAREYAVAARASGAGPWRILWRHLLPASFSFLGTQALLLVPAFIVAEATLSYVGLGFAPPVPSWGNMLQDAANARAISEFPWMLAPALAIAVVVFALNLAIERGDPLA